MIKIFESFRRKVSRRPGADPLAIANAILEELKVLDQEATMVRLQRLMVLVQGWSLALNDESAYNAATVIVGDTPSVPGIYKAFRKYGSGPIRGAAAFPELPSFDYPADDDPKRLEIIRSVVRGYGDFNAYDLGMILRRSFPELTPNQIIPRSTLRDSFLELIATRKAA